MTAPTSATPRERAESLLRRGEHANGREFLAIGWALISVADAILTTKVADADRLAAAFAAHPALADVVLPPLDHAGVEGHPMQYDQPLPEVCTNCLAPVRADWPGGTWYPPPGHTIRANGSIVCPDEAIVTVGLAALADHVEGIMRQCGLDMSDSHTYAAIRAAITGWEG